MDKTNTTVGTETKAQPSLTPEALKSLVENSLDDDKAQDLTVIDLAGKSSLADHMVIASGTSRRQVSSMADHLVQRLKQAGIENPAINGEDQGDWVLIDAGDIIVHLFRPEVRDFYNLEKMWAADMSDETHGVDRDREGVIDA